MLEVEVLDGIDGFGDFGEIARVNFFPEKKIVISKLSEQLPEKAKEIKEFAAKHKASEAALKTLDWESLLLIGIIASGVYMALHNS